MPYIPKARKNAIEQRLVKVSKPGDLNYVLTKMCIDYIEECGLSYQSINDVVGALEGCKTEFYWKVARPYEDRKEKENGPVY